MELFNKLETKTLRRQLRKNSTPEENKIWHIVRNRKILNLKFFRQYAVNNYILDFYCPEIKLCIEIDGGHHNKNSNDTIRTEYLNAINIVVLRFWNNDVNKNLDGVYEKIYIIAESLLKTHPSPLFLKERG